MAMNAAAEPFFPKEEVVETKSELPGQSLYDEAGVEAGPGGMSGTTIWRPQYKGRIRSFSEQKGFGFIDCAETLRAFGRDVFIHRFQMAEAGLMVGQEVLFEVEVNKSGQPQGRRVRPNQEEMQQQQQQQQYWNMSSDMSQYGYGYDDYYGGADGWGGDYSQMGYPGYGQEKYSPGRTTGYKSDRGMNTGDPGPPEHIEEMLRGCSSSSDMWEIIEQYGHSFGKKHVVTALNQLALCRQYEKHAAEATLTSALVDRLVLFSASELTAEEASKVLWALVVLEEVRDHAQAHRFAMDLGEQAIKCFSEFTPDKMASFVRSLSRLVRDPSEDELVGRITTQFSDYALGGSGSMPRFPPHELTTWTAFLKEAAQASQGGGGHDGPPPYGSMPGKGTGAFGKPGAYPGSPGMGMAPPYQAMGKGMPPMGGVMGKGPMGMPPGANGFGGPGLLPGKGIPAGPLGGAGGISLFGGGKPGAPMGPMGLPGALGGVMGRPAGPLGFDGNAGMKGPMGGGKGPDMYGGNPALAGKGFQPGRVGAPPGARPVGHQMPRAAGPVPAKGGP